MPVPASVIVDLPITIDSTSINNGTASTLLRNEGGKVGDTDYTVPKTDGTANQVLQTNGAGVVTWATISTGITIGTTPITSGTDTRVLFQNSGTVQQSANFTYDGTLGFNVGNNTVGYVKTSTQNISGASVGEITNYSLNNFPLVRLTGTDLSTYFSGRIGLYYGNTEKAYLKASSLGGEIGGFNALFLQAKGALSTDIALRVRNSADNLNMLQVNGNNSIYMLGDGDAGSIRLSKQTGHSTLLQQRSSNSLPSIFTIAAYAQGGAVGQIKLDALFGDGSTPAFTVSRLISGVTDLTGTSLYGAFGTNATCFVMKNASGYVGYGTNPNAVVDHFSMYSADIVAGNAAPHFRTENGTIVKLYQNAAVTSAQGIADALTNLGVLASSTIVDSDGFTVIVKSANQDVTNSATLVDDTSLQFSVVAGGHYMVIVDLVISCNSAAGDYKSGLKVSSGTMKGSGILTGTSSTALAQNTAYNVNGVATTSIVTSGTNAPDLDLLASQRIMFSFTASANATFSFQFAQNSAVLATTARTWKGSILKYKRLD
jgi:hypothetical protein